MQLSTFVGAAAIGLLAGAASADLIMLNGGFEDAGPGGATDSAMWSEFIGGPAGTLSERDDSMPASGNWAHRIVAVGDDSGGASAGINQNSIVDGGLPSLQELTMLTLNFDAKVDLGPGGVGFYVLRVLNGDGAIVADSALQSLTSTGGAYESFSTSVEVPAFGGAPNDTYAAFVEFVASAGAFQGSTSEVFVDNVVVDGTLVPAPSACVALAAACGFGGLRRRR